MTRRNRREIESDLDELAEDTGDGGSVIAPGSLSTYRWIAGICGQ